MGASARRQGREWFRVVTWRPLHDGEPERSVPLACSLSQLASRLDTAPPDVLALLFGHWEEVAGAEIAEHACPVALVAGVLTVRVDDQRWVTQLKWLASSMATKLNDKLGRPVVERVEFRLGPLPSRK